MSEPRVRRGTYLIIIAIKIMIADKDGIVRTPGTVPSIFLRGLVHCIGQGLSI